MTGRVQTSVRAGILEQSPANRAERLCRLPPRHGVTRRMGPIQRITARLMNNPPDGLPTYRLLTGFDDAAFCRRVSDALALGYELYGSPAATFDGQNVIVAQALVWPSIAQPER